mmetsp:Transcript_140996/g.351627  ORF Transcript_140996/g.351627 Transcript_140996/m.351627 type:complete len:221 (+) Transcript_140996:871-1533(+)
MDAALEGRLGKPCLRALVTPAAAKTHPAAQPQGPVGPTPPPFLPASPPPLLSPPLPSEMPRATCPPAAAGASHPERDRANGAVRRPARLHLCHWRSHQCHWRRGRRRQGSPQDGAERPHGSQQLPQPRAATVSPPPETTLEAGWLMSMTAQQRGGGFWAQRCSPAPAVPRNTGVSGAGPATTPTTSRNPALSRSSQPGSAFGTNASRWTAGWHRCRRGAC